MRPPRPKPQENRRPSSISATLWNLAAATAVTRRRRSASSRAGAVATLVDPVPYECEARSTIRVLCLCARKWHESHVRTVQGLEVT